MKEEPVVYIKSKTLFLAASYDFNCYLNVQAQDVLLSGLPTLYRGFSLKASINVGAH